MKIQSHFYTVLQQHCTANLLLKLKDVDINDINENEWDITSISSDIDLMKIAYAFEQIGGTLLYDGKETQYMIITRDKGDVISNHIRLFWIHSSENGIRPIYDIGNVDVPPILPKYVSSPKEDGTYIVERLTFGEYKPVDGMVFFREEDSKAQAKELNDGYNNMNAPE